MIKNIATYILVNLICPSLIGITSGYFVCNYARGSISIIITIMLIIAIAIMTLKKIRNKNINKITKERMV